MSEKRKKLSRGGVAHVRRRPLDSFTKKILSFLRDRIFFYYYL